LGYKVTQDIAVRVEMRKVFIEGLYPFEGEVIKGSEKMKNT